MAPERTKHRVPGESGLDDDPVTIIAQPRELGFHPEATRVQYGASLLVLSGPEAGHSMPIEAKVTRIGRSRQCEVCLDVPDVSRHHATITRDDYGEYEVEDNSSRNGVTINGHAVSRQTLRYGDRIGIGNDAVLLFTHYDQLGELLLQRQRMESIGALAGGVAHDFNNLLGAILANVNALQAEVVGRSSDEEEILDDIRAATMRASELTAQLLAFARRGQYELRPTSASQICQEALRLASRTFRPNVELNAEVDARLVVMGDPSQLHQVVMNLLINGRDAMPEGGQLSIAGHSVDGREVVGLDPRLSYAAIRVTDTGKGMDASTKQRVFEPFFTTKALGQGTGLGLATAYGIVKNHGGDIRVDSHPGHGSSFIVYLPLHRGPSVEPASPPPPQKSTFRAKDVTLLVVDDDHLFIRALERLLAQSGFRMYVATSGAEALSVLAERPYEIRVVLLDVLMPRMGGQEVFSHIRKTLPDLPVILMSGYADVESAQQMQRAGAAAFLRKPVTREQLNEAIGDALAGERAAQVTPARAIDV